MAQRTLGSWCKPRNRPAGHVVTAANLGQRLLAVVAVLDCFALLVVGHLGLAPHLHALCLGAFAAFAGAGADQFAFELGKGSAGAASGACP
jgi:uncharacterized membrane protein